MRMRPENAHAERTLRQLEEKRAKVREFEALMDEHGVKDPARFVLRQWVEEHLIGPVLEVAERTLRGIQRRN